MWFFEAVLEYRGKHNSNIGKKGVLNCIHGQDWVRIADVVIAFLLPNRRKSKIGLRPEKKLIRPKFCSTKYTVQAGCTRAWAVHENLLRMLAMLQYTKFSTHCAMWLQYFWTPLTGFLHMSVIVKTQLGGFRSIVKGFRNNTDSQLALECPEDKMVAHLVLHVTCWRYDGLKMVARTYSLPPWCTTMVASASTSAAKAMTLCNILFVALCVAPASLSKGIYNAKICRHAFGLVLDDLCNWVDLLLPKAAPSSNKL